MVTPVLSIDTTVAYLILLWFKILNVGVVHGKQKQSKGIFNVLSVSQGAILFSHPTSMCPNVRQSPQPVGVGLVQLFNVTELPKQLQQLTMFAIVVCVLNYYLQ
jgi:hypothetical protein